jgi:hypothetical protein
MEGGEGPVRRVLSSSREAPDPGEDACDIASGTLSRAMRPDDVQPADPIPHLLQPGERVELALLATTADCA